MSEISSPAEKRRNRPDALKTIGDFYAGVPKPTHAENERLARTDRRELARRNIPLVIYVVGALLRLPSAGRAGKRAGFMHDAGAKIGFSRNDRTKADDLIQDGLVGLMRAAAIFDPERGLFSTCAIPWIIAAIQQSNTRQAAVHVPSDVLRQVRVERHRLSAAADMSVGRVIAGFKDIDGPFGERGEETMADYIPGAHEPTLERVAAQHELTRLDALERRVIEHRFGIVGPPLDLMATARVCGITRREARETERRALRKMQAVA